MPPKGHFRSGGTSGPPDGPGEAFAGRRHQRFPAQSTGAAPGRRYRSLEGLRRQRKFDPLFEQDPWQVQEVSDRGVILEKQGQVRRRHKDDVKLTGMTTAASCSPSFPLYFWDDSEGQADTDLADDPTVEHALPSAGVESDIDRRVQEVMAERDRLRGLAEHSN